MKKLKQREWQLLTTNSEEMAFKSGDVIFKESDEEYCVYRIVEGSVKVEVPRSHGRVLVNRLHPNAVFGEMSLLGKFDGRAIMTADSEEVQFLLQKTNLCRFIYRNWRWHSLLEFSSWSPMSVRDSTNILHQFFRTVLKHCHLSIK
jgi:signal-transduction protein with cAMP-binding, CBS, and nucleotidyltransferase domain